MTITRTDALRNVVNLQQPLADAIEALDEFEWDSDTELVTLSRADISQVLSSYLDGSASTEDVQQWAETLEGRDDLGREPGAEQLINDALFELATPELSQDLTEESARSWRARLEV